MLNSKFAKSKASAPSRGPSQEAEIVEIKPLVDHAIDCARNWNFEGAKKAIEQAKRRLEE